MAKSEREVELERVLEEAKKRICPWCNRGDPISLDEDGVDRKGMYHSFFGGNRECRAGFIQEILPSPKGPPKRPF